ncbi:hypothetical protein [Desulfovibrio litoralis]|uniref:Uncharacterized protein n=1 Tax=Desulfovibrio litoralis DSM 11393 TaxID=1121455 RepID=A0A1M7SXE6_9BACT|nr:hypothetical protein [Desulfovibrio litoralis]SHN63169.1 hypothetical protein SAMN02745728_01349 [Desulfovibrio litoralis DSM 11393]
MLKSQTIKELQEKHPLFSKITGQVVWVACEEQGMNEEHINMFMDSFMELRETTLELMFKLKDNPSSFLLIKKEPRFNHLPCSGCNSMVDCIIPASAPDIYKYMPPYSINCVCRGEYLKAEEALEYASKKQCSIKDLFPKTLPEINIYCDNNESLSENSDF